MRLKMVKKDTFIFLSITDQLEFYNFFFSWSVLHKKVSIYWEKKCMKYQQIWNIRVVQIASEISILDCLFKLLCQTSYLS